MRREGCIGTNLPLPRAARMQCSALKCCTLSGRAFRKTPAGSYLGERGSWQASIVLAVFAQSGTEMPVEKTAAYFHLQVALLQGGAAASDQVRRHSADLIETIAKDQAREIEAEAQAWYQEHSARPVLARFKGQEKFFAEPAGPNQFEVLNAALSAAVPAS